MNKFPLCSFCLQKYIYFSKILSFHIGYYSPLHGIFLPLFVCPSVTFNHLPHGFWKRMNWTLLVENHCSKYRKTQKIQKISKWSKKVKTGKICFGQPLGHFCLNRFTKKLQLKTTSKQPKKCLKTTSKLPKKLPKNMKQVQTPPPFLHNVQKKVQWNFQTFFSEYFRHVWLTSRVLFKKGLLKEICVFEIYC